MAFVSPVEAEEHALRVFDALHPAAADSFQALLRAAVAFACFDGELNGAPKVHGVSFSSGTKS